MTKYTYDSIKNEVEDRLIACYSDVAMLYGMDYIVNEKRPL